MVSTLDQIAMLSQYDGEKRIKLEKDWNKEGGHPCVQYTAEWNSWYEKKKKITYDAFGVFLEDDKKITSINKEPPSLFIYPINSPKERPKDNYSPLSQEDLEASRDKLEIDTTYKQPIKSVNEDKNSNEVGDEETGKQSDKKKNGVINKLKAVFGIKSE